jgi:hypothetical protein
MSSTLVQIKRSTANAVPGSLQAGESAYSYASNVLFIGTNANTVINIGGKTYTDLLDNGSAANGSSTFVRRYANGSAQFQQLDILVSPTANSHVATKAYVDGALTSNISLNTLTDVIVTGADVDQNNRILIGHANGQYLTTSVTGNVSISNTGVVTIGAQQVVGSMLNDTLAGNKTFSDTITIGKDLTVSGNLTVLGNTVTVNVETLSVEDSLIKLASNNTTDVVDIGFYGVYNSNTFAGLFRDATDNRFKLFTDYTGGDPSANVIGTVIRATLEANLDAQLVNATSLGVQTLIANGHSTLTSANLSGSINVATNATITGDLAINGGDLTTTATTFNVTNTSATTLNIGGAATTIRLGAATGNTIINNSLDVSKNVSVTQNVSVTGTGSFGSLTLGSPLSIASGGTGRNTLVANGVVFGNTTSSSYNFATGTEGQVLQIDAGVPAFAMLDGGSF